MTRRGSKKEVLEMKTRQKICNIIMIFHSEISYWEHYEIEKKRILKYCSQTKFNIFWTRTYVGQKLIATENREFWFPPGIYDVKENRITSKSIVPEN